MKLRYIAVLAIGALAALPLMAQQAPKTDAPAKPADKVAAHKDDAKTKKDHDASAAVNPASGFWAALRTIVVADMVMGLDNVLAVAGAAHGSFLLVALGLLISVPIMVLN